MADTLSLTAKVDMENVKWYSSSQVSTAKHVSYPQLTATRDTHTNTLGQTSNGSAGRARTNNRTDATKYIISLALRSIKLEPLLIIRPEYME